MVQRPSTTGDQIRRREAAGAVRSLAERPVWGLWLELKACNYETHSDCEELWEFQQNERGKAEELFLQHHPASISLSPCLQHVSPPPRSLCVCVCVSVLTHIYIMELVFFSFCSILLPLVSDWNQLRPWNVYFILFSVLKGLTGIKISLTDWNSRHTPQPGQQNTTFQ